MADNKKEKVLLKNTLMLYVLTFSSYLFNFLTVPYQTRVLGPVICGVLGVAVATMTYFQHFMDFGFLLSATEDISRNREDKSYVSKKLTSVFIIKIMFAVISFVIVLLLTTFVEEFAKNRSVYIVYIFAYIAYGFLPDYFFRGVERMSAVTIRTVVVKGLSCLFTFVFMRDEGDFLVVPALLLIGNLGAVIWAYAYIFKKLGYKFEKVSKKEVLSDLKRSSHFFCSRIATTIYSTTNTIILSFIDAAGVSTGYYTTADKVVSAAKSGITPISDSVYPYMVKNKNFGLIKKLMLVLEPIIILGCVVVFIFAEPLCVFAFGSEYAGTAPILRAFLPTIVAILPNYIFGFPTLGAMGISKYANHSIFFGTGVQICGLVILFATGNLSAVMLALMTSISEWSIMLFRITQVWRNRHLINS